MKKSVLLLAIAIIAFSASAQDENPTYQKRDVNMPTEHMTSPSDHNYSQQDKGFWFSVEATGGYSANVSKQMDNTAFAEMDFYVGYRTSEFFRVGMGLGGRYYFNPGILRRKSHNWAIPIMINVRGNIIPQDYRTVVPYYSVDVGSTVTDGFLLRPTLGIRCGERRSAFLLGVSYMLQVMSGYESKYEPGNHNEKTLNTSFFGLRIGYEF